MSDKQFNDFEEFWPHFLSSHRHPATRWAHVVSTAIAARGALKSLRKGSIRPLVTSAIAAGAFVTLAHKIIEGNQPENLGHPLWGARAFARLCIRTVTGSIADDIANLPSES